ncbi:MAG TPA: GNAT family N-acetyltransferase [Acidobacteriota bacterium]
MTVPSMVEKIEDLAQFENLREEWNQSLKASTSDGLFLTWEWLYTWWKHLSEKRRLFILLVRSQGELDAIAPLALQPPQPARLLPFRSLQFLGTGSVGSDYLDLIVRQGKEHDALRTLAQYLTREKLMIELAQVSENSRADSKLVWRLKEQGWSVFERKTYLCPFIKLSGHSWQSYLASLGPAHRYNFNRRLRNLIRQFDVRFDQVRSEEELSSGLASLVALHNMRWCERGGSNAFHSPALRAFHEEFSRLALRCGWLRLFILWLDGKPAASVYGFRYGRSFLFYQSAFHPAYSKLSVGLIALGLSIKSAVEEGAEEYDLLHGDEQYKFHWAREARELVGQELYPPGARGLLYKRTLALRRTSKKIVRSVLVPAVGGQDDRLQVKFEILKGENRASSH